MRKKSYKKYQYIDMAGSCESDAPYGSYPRRSKKGVKYKKRLRRTNVMSLPRGVYGRPPRARNRRPVRVVVRIGK